MINVNESGHSMSIVTILLNDPSNNILTINPRFIKFVTHIITIVLLLLFLLTTEKKIMGKKKKSKTFAPTTQ